MTKIFCRIQNYGDNIELGMIRETNEGPLFAQPLIFQRIEEGGIIQPAAILSRVEAQRLMDELWSCGIRPAEGAGSAGQMAATERHIRDLQRIAFGALKRLKID